MKSVIYRTILFLVMGTFFFFSCKKEDCIPELHSPPFKIIFIDGLTNQPQSIELDSLEIISHTQGLLKDFGEFFPPKFHFNNDTLLLNTDPHIYNFELFYKTRLIENIMVVLEDTSIVECNIFYQIDTIKTNKSIVCQFNKEFLVKISK